MIFVPTGPIWIVNRILDPEGGGVGGSHFVLPLEPGGELAQGIWDNGTREGEVFLRALWAVVVVVLVHCGEGVRAGQLGGRGGYESGSGSLLLSGFPMP